MVPRPLDPPDPRQPRTYLEVPQTFGLRSSKARNDLPPDGRPRDLREAAMMQHVVVQSVRTLMSSQGLNQSELAAVAKIPRRTLVRILSGEAWVQTHHLVSLGRVLGTSLYAVPRLEDLTFETTWVGMAEPQGTRVDQAGAAKGASS